MKVIRKIRSIYSHALPRPLEASVLLDAITSATDSPEKFKLNVPGFPSGRSIRASPRSAGRADEA